MFSIWSGVEILHCAIHMNFVAIRRFDSVHEDVSDEEIGWSTRGLIVGFSHTRFVGSAIILTTTRRGGVPSSAMTVPPGSCGDFLSWY